MTKDTEKDITSISKSKVASLIKKYSLTGLGRELEQHWTATGDEHWSLRDLADYFNKEILRKALTEAGIQSVDGEVENIYRIITEEEISTADRTQLRRRLEREGMDIEEVKNDFVTYQAIRSYVKDYRGSEYNPPERDRTEKEKQNIQKLRGRLISMIENTIGQLRNTEQIQLGEFRVLVDVRILCDDCGSQYGVTELLTEGKCECYDSS